MSDHFQSYPLGHSINGSPHSVCVSLPTMADVIGYEEKDPGVLGALQSGYPRFFRNPLITQLAEQLSEEGCMATNDPLLPTEGAALDLCSFLGIDGNSIAPVETFWTVRLPRNDAGTEKESRSFLQHTGCGLSSREAEAFLERHYGHQSFDEERSLDTPENNLSLIRGSLHEVYGTAVDTDIHIFRSGMNAFYTGFRALQAIQLQRKKDLWIQLGWLYVDTSRILERFSLRGADPIQVYSVMDLGELKDILTEHGHRVAGIVTEVPTNPLVQTPDLKTLRALADKVGAALILDPTLVSPHNVNVLSYSDLHINSLTKYAATSGDIMMGALALNPDSAFYDDLLQIVKLFGTPPSSGDLARMAVQIKSYPDNIRKINASTEKIARFLESHHGTKAVYWARSEPSAYNYNWLQHREAGPGGIISFTTQKPVAAFYDPSKIAKSPSFGSRFSMMCPFMYLAHYDLVRTAEGREFLNKQGVDPDLIRLSVGLEPVDAIIEELARTLS